MQYFSRNKLACIVMGISYCYDHIVVLIYLDAWLILILLIWTSNNKKSFFRDIFALYAVIMAIRYLRKWVPVLKDMNISFWNTIQYVELSGKII